MGIKFLNRFLLDNCNKKSIKKTHLKMFENKTIVIDTSIYLYKFMGENTLLESMYLFISILKNYNINPIFVFDGKPPPEKKELLIQRRIEKLEAEQKYNELQKNMTDETVLEMEQLKKQFIRIKDEDINKVKELMDAYGIIYLDAEGEADILCSYLIKVGIAWGCISDDMDMFLYGCKRVLRHLSLLNHTIVHYDYDLILKDLQMSEEDFRSIMVISGTDYNIKTDTCLYETIKWYYEYNKYLKNTNESNKMNFYDWLYKNTKYIKNYDELMKIYEMFIIEKYYEQLKGYVNKCEKKEMDLIKLQDIMTKEGFVFVV